MPDINQNKTTSVGMTPEMIKFWDRKMLLDVKPNLIHDQFAAKRPLPANNGKVINFRRWDDLPKAMLPIQEGITPTGQALSVSEINATVQQYGGWVQMTDTLDLTAVDDINSGAQERMARQATQTLDALTRDVITAGTAVNYVKGTGVGVTYDSRLKLDSSCKITLADILDAVAELRAKNVKPIGDSYVCLVHPYIERDLLDDSNFREWNKSQHAEKIYKAEIGQYGDCRFVTSSECKVFGSEIFPGVLDWGANGTTLTSSGVSTNTITFTKKPTQDEVDAINAAIAAGIDFYVVDVDAGTPFRMLVKSANIVSTYLTLTVDDATGFTSGDDIGGDCTATGDAVFATMVIGEEAYGVTDLEGGGLEFIMKPLGYGNDPLNQRSSAGWKATRAATRLNEAYMIRIESVSPNHLAVASN